MIVDRHPQHPLQMAADLSLLNVGRMLSARYKFLHACPLSVPCLSGCLPCQHLTASFCRCNVLSREIVRCNDFLEANQIC